MDIIVPFRTAQWNGKYMRLSIESFLFKQVPADGKEGKQKAREMEER